MAFRLPPPPTSGHQQQQQQNLAPQSILDNYLNLRNSYMNMINNKDNDDLSAAVDPAAPALVPPPTAAASAHASFEASPFMADQADMSSFRELLELCGMTPDGTPALQNFDGSPMEETPLFTPALDMFSTPYLDGWDTSPAMGDRDSFDALPPLFDVPKTSNVANQNETHHSTIADPAELFTLPHTPALAPAALLPEESATSNHARNKAGPTGFRKGMVPTNMVPMDAPTQPRQYLGDSKTSRKDVPAAFQNKTRKRKHADDEDDIPDDIQDAITAKRRLNTLAARRSRARKAQTALDNEQRIDDLHSQLEHLQQELVRVTAERDTYRAQLGLM